jgi:hypothetical protein
LRDWSVHQVLEELVPQVQGDLDFSHARVGLGVGELEPAAL